MIGYLRRFLIRYLFSPYGIAVVPYCGFLFAWTFPPNTYTYYIREPDLMYHNPTVLLFYTACVAAFMVGVRIVGLFDTKSSVTAVPKLHLRSASPLLYLVGPLLVATVPCLMLLSIIGSSINFVSLILSQQGNVMKQAITGASSSGYWGSALFVLTGVLWWAAYRFSQLDLKGGTRRTFYAVYAVAFGVELVTCLATFDRTNLMPLLAGSTLIYLFFKTRGENVRLGRLAFVGFGSVFVIMGAFVSLQLARAASRLDDVITSMLGYTIVSYNRMAALIMGVMHYIYEGKGAYVVAFLLENQRFSGISGQMGLPNAYVLWASEFPALSAGGLNSGYNWASVFGYLFSDLGWWTPLYMLVAGLFAGYLWSRFRAGTPFGIVFYPWMAFWILFWFGWNLLLDARGVVLIETSMLLAVYDRIFLHRSSAASSGRPAASHTPWAPVGTVPTIVATTHRGGLL